MCIPRIIHQTWKDERVPEAMAPFVETWKANHPDWEYRLWTDADNAELVRGEYPELWPRYESYPYPIQRADAARYCILHRHGGLYVDLDFECRKAVGPLLEGHECVLGLEPALHCEFHDRDRIVGNAIMAARPGHPLMEEAIFEMRTSEPAMQNENTVVLETTGPFMLERALERRPDGVTLAASELLYPLTLPELGELLVLGWSPELEDKVAGAYAVHHHHSTWWR